MLGPNDPQRLGRYEIVEVLGKGAMGVVYLARDPLIGRRVALKTFRTVFDEHEPESAEFRARFIREAQSAGILSHPHIVTIHDVVEASDEGVTFIAMEYVSGENLKEMLRRGHTFTLEDICGIVEQMAGALDYAHRQGVIHRDIKPANVMIDEAGRVKITDFGIARLDTSDLTQEGQLLGTPNYMAPERILGKPVDHRTDIFSLGVVLYELLTRQKPFRGENLTMVTHRIVYEAFTPPSDLAPVPKAIEQVIGRALEKDPQDRHDSAGELARELRGAVAALPRDLSATASVAGLARAPDGERDAGAETRDVSSMVPPPPPAPVARGGRTARRSFWWAAAAVLFLVGAVGAGVALWRGDHGQPPPAATRQESAPHLDHLEAARAHLAADRLPEARRELALARRLAPGGEDVTGLEREVARREEEAARAAVDRQVAAWVEEAQTALEGRRLGEAEAAARRALEAAPEDAAAQAILVEVGRRRADARRAAEQRTATPPAAVAPPVEPVTVEEPPTFLLDILFATAISEGTVLVYANDGQVMRETFNFNRRVGILRSEPGSGRLDQTVVLPRGRVGFKVWATAKGKSAEMIELAHTFSGGSHATLEVIFRKGGQLSARVLEGPATPPP